MMRRFKLEEMLFGILFVMTETVGPPSAWPFLKTAFLFWIDLGQVLRVMTSPGYGWSPETYNLMKKIDLVYVLADLVSRVMPRYSLFILASLLVMFALADTAFVAKLFRGGGKVQTMWPVKLLKFLVATIVTTLFSSVTKWLLIPLECLVSSEASLSQALHGDEAPCTPWLYPEVVFSVFTCGVTSLYVAFALTTSFMALEVNPLARGVRSSSTGRVEGLWLANKIAVTFLIYFAVWVKTVTCAVVLLLMTLWVLHKHTAILPFHNHLVNLLRGGVYTSVAWLALAQIIVVSTEPSQAREWALIAMIPLFFLVGIGLTHLSRWRLLCVIERLRADFEALQLLHSAQQQLPREHHCSPMGIGYPSGSSNMKQPASGTLGGARRTTVEAFYDTTWDRRKAFPTELNALAVLRTLLYRRKKREVELLLHLSARAMEEHPDSNILRLFHLKILRFVMENQAEANVVMKRFKMDHKKLSVEQRYMLYALERKSTQESIGAYLGTGTVSAINVMEFDAGMDRATKAHNKCILSLKKFWTVASKPFKSNAEHMMVLTMMEALDDFSESVSVAQQEYHSLLELYPSAVSVLCSYATFSDTILNDTKEAEKLRHQASLLESSDHCSEEGSVSAAPSGAPEGAEVAAVPVARSADMGDGASSMASSVEPWRDQISRNMQSLTGSVLELEMKAVRRLHARVKVFVLLLLIFATAGFVLTNKFLLGDMATANIHSIDATQKFGVYSVSALYSLRNMRVAAARGDEAWMEAERERVGVLLEEMRATHQENFDTTSSGPVADYYHKAELPTRIPVEIGWVERTSDFWDLGNDYARRLQRAVMVNIEELIDPNYSLAEISDEKKNLAYAFENTLPEMLENYEVLLDFYVDEVHKIAGLTQTLVAVNVTVNALLVVLIAVFLIRAILTVIPRVQHYTVLCRMALEMPRELRLKFRKVYTTLEEDIAVIEDEEKARHAMEEGGFAVKRNHSDQSMGMEGVLDAVGMHHPDSEGEGGGDPIEPSFQRLSEEALERHGRGFESRNRDRRHSIAESVESWAQDFAQLTASGAPSTKTLPISPMRSPLRSPQQRSPLRGNAASMPSAPLVFGPQSPWIDDDAGRVTPCKEEEEDETASGKGDRNSDDGFTLGPAAVGAVLHHEHGSCKSILVEKQGRDHQAGASGGETKQHDEEGKTSLGDVGLMSSVDAGRDRDEEDVVPEEDQENVASDGDDGEVKRSRIAFPARRLRDKSAGRDSDPLKSIVHRTKPSPNGQHSPKSHDGDSTAAPASDTDTKSGLVVKGAGTRTPRAPPSPPSPLVEVKVDTDPAENERNDEGSRKSRKKPTIRFSANQGSFGTLKTGFRALHSSFSFKNKGKWDTTEKQAPMELEEDGHQGPRGALARCVLSEQVDAELSKVSVRFKAWQSRIDLTTIILLIIIGLCIISTLFPTRSLGSITDMAPMVDMAGRRHYMVQECIFLARELIFGDGFSRMTQQEIAGHLNLSLEKFKRMHQAVRSGDDLGIHVGADDRYPVHNQIMYQPGCVWKHDYRRSAPAADTDSQGSTEDCGLPGRPDVGEQGLQYLIQSFFDSIENLLYRYGPPSSEWTTKSSGEQFQWIELNAEGFAISQADEDMAFVNQSMYDNLFVGLDAIHEIFHHETFALLELARYETLCLYSVYVVAIVIGFYGVFFRSICSSALMDVQRARSFVSQLPLHHLSKSEFMFVSCDFFSWQEDSS
eukprot:CAMPEP_0181288294 /NCGR_PEP_ID=MMETSP1101-20121128/256_1 /TAXON_ID=46948 /ORGANISM="Rhodomonas abbreviata, Strain Caron Lab Isolate" /LENGTH=1714 /DNA_ID=CAMNT_0023392407 /DNA_START=283 /DNA_END=5427 /DNA_ORIENTATION=-